MSMPPCLMRLKIKNQRHHFSLWIPLFLAWLILFVFALALSPLVLVLVVILWLLGFGKFLMLGPYIYQTLCALRDLEIDINDKQEKIFLSFK
jgi:hypothetical protein